MENQIEQRSKEEIYRKEIFELLNNSLENLTEKELNLLEGLFMKDDISEEELIRKIIE
jgi:hypothetical protein